MSIARYLYRDSTIRIVSKIVSKLSLIHSEARPHEIFQAELFWHLEGLFSLLEHLDSVQGEYPDFLSHMAEADQIKGPVEEPDTAWVHLVPGLFLPAHGVIDDLSRFSVDGRVVDSVQDLLEFVLGHTLQKRIFSPCS